MTQQAVQEIIEKSKTDISALHELDGGSLEVIVPPLRELWLMGLRAVEQRADYRQAGQEQEWLKSEAKAHRDPDYNAKAYEIARDILMNHPDFEWTLRTKLGRMTYLLNEEKSKPSMHPSRAYWDAHGNFSTELGFASLIPGDAAFRIIGPCLFSPYYPPYDDIDVIQHSPADRARGTLAGLLKTRCAEDLPLDIEAARAWWKANEHRFAEKETASPNTHNTSKAATPGASQNEAARAQDSQREDGSAGSTDSRSVSNGALSRVVWPATIGVLAALLLAGALFLFKRR